MGKLKWLRGTINDKLIGRDPAHIRNDVRAGRTNSSLTDDCEYLQPIGSERSESQSQRILTNIDIHMELTIMQAGKTFQSNRLLRILDDWIAFRRHLWNAWTTVDERIPSKCEELFIHVFMLKSCSKAASTNDSQNIRSISGYLVITKTIEMKVWPTSVCNYP